MDPLSGAGDAVGALRRIALRDDSPTLARGRRTRARRWLTPPLAGFTTILLLPAALALD